MPELELRELEVAPVRFGERSALAHHTGWKGSSAKQRKLSKKGQVCTTPLFEWCQ